MSYIEKKFYELQKKTTWILYILGISSHRILNGKTELLFPLKEIVRMQQIEY
jgi:hypothetical protein